ncbi:hypothetical protein D3C71_1383590 [compost metagenome]
MTQIGAPFQQVRRQSGGYRRQCQLRQAAPADDGAGVASKQHGQVVFLLCHLGLELRDRGLGALELGEVLRQFHFGNGAGSKAQLEDLVGFAAGLGGSAGNFQFPIQIAQGDVARCHRRHQAQDHRAPTFFRGQQVSPGGLVEAPQAAPDVQLPANTESGLVAVVDRVNARVQGHRAVVPGRPVAVALCADADLRIHLRANLAVTALELLDPRSGDLDVFVLGQCTANQLIEDRVLELLPPQAVGQRADLMVGVAIGRGSVRGRALVIRADHATAQAQAQHQGNREGTHLIPPHGVAGQHCREYPRVALPQEAGRSVGSSPFSR